MKFSLKPLHEQTIVITGASSGIGLTAARMAAQRGARVVAASRNEGALAELREEITSAGGRCEYVVADVSSVEDCEHIAQVAEGAFGGVDTWVNNAGVSVYGRLEQVTLEDHRRLFETNFWGVVNGSRVAAGHMKQRFGVAGGGGVAGAMVGTGVGGAIINIGSILSERAIPLQGMYSASKHAVKGFTEALRMELEAEEAPISVTLIKPSAIDTPYTEHAKNYMEVEPTNPAPVYAPETVARAILYCAQHKQRDVTVGGAGKVITFTSRAAPRLADRLMERVMIAGQRTHEPAQPRGDAALYDPGLGLRQRGRYGGPVRERSYYTTASLHPVILGAAALGVGVAVAAVWKLLAPAEPQTLPERAREMARKGIKRARKALR